MIFSFMEIFAQSLSPELISSSGDSFSNATYQLDWSVGEVLTTTHVSGNIIITQGFHQNNYVITTVESFETQIDMIIYPNPTTNFINLQIENELYEKMQYQLTDITGKILQIRQIVNMTEQIDFSIYSNGIYLLSVFQNNQIIKSFKIQKIN